VAIMNLPRRRFLQLAAGAADTLLRRTTFLAASPEWIKIPHPADDAEPDPASPGWEFESEALAPEGDSLAVGVSLTHDTAPRVRDYVQAARCQRRAPCSSPLRILVQAPAPWCAEGTPSTSPRAWLRR
jgi:hypothetical protein